MYIEVHMTLPLRWCLKQHKDIFADLEKMLSDKFEGMTIKSQSTASCIFLAEYHGIDAEADILQAMHQRWPDAPVTVSAADAFGMEAVMPKDIEKKLRELTGADEFKALLEEMRRAAPGLRQHGGEKTFRYQHILFCCDAGCGLSTFLQMYTDCADDLFLVNLEDGDVVEYRLTEGANWLEAAMTKLLHCRDTALCLDLSEKMDQMETPEMKELLEAVSLHAGDGIVMFRIPFVEQGVRDHVVAVLSDQLFVRPVTIYPFTAAQLTELSQERLGRQGYRLPAESLALLERRIAFEKSDGRFYGVRTIDKLVYEMCYRKAAAATPGDEITPEDLQGFVPAEPEKTTEMLWNQLCGMEGVRGQLEQAVEQIVYARRNGIEAPCIHMRFIGSPGTGKTTAARILGRMLHERGVLRKGHFVEYQGRALCGSYVGETAPRTERIVREALGGVLFLDEAYSLYRGSDSSVRDYGREALDTLVACMENHRDDLVVVLAGYQKEMDTLLEANPGLRDRIPYEIVFPNYSRGQLEQIFLEMARRRFPCSGAMQEAVHTFFAGLRPEVLESNTFGNARFVRNLFERTWGMAYARSVEFGTDMTLQPEDLQAAAAELLLHRRQERRRPTIGFMPVTAQK